MRLALRIVLGILFSPILVPLFVGALIIASWDFMRDGKWPWE